MSFELILASASPRRRELLASLGIGFRVVPPEVEEPPNTYLTPRAFVLEMAQRKAEVVATIHTHAWVIGADTIVVIDGEVLGKPRDRADAKRMLTLLADREHLVLTGYCLINKGEAKAISGVEETVVKIGALEQEDIEWYINTGEPFDKAGGYAIQGRGAFMVDWIHGSFTNVVGLPLNQLVRIFKEAGIDAFANGPTSHSATWE